MNARRKRQLLLIEKLGSEGKTLTSHAKAKYKIDNFKISKAVWQNINVPWQWKALQAENFTTQDLQFVTFYMHETYNKFKGFVNEDYKSDSNICREVTSINPSFPLFDDSGDGFNTEETVSSEIFNAE